MGLQQQAVEVLERAEQRIDGAVIRDIVAGVGLRRAVEGDSYKASTPSRAK